MAVGPESARIARPDDVDRVLELLGALVVDLSSARGGAPAATALVDVLQPGELAKRLSLPEGGGVIVGTFDCLVVGLALVDLPGEADGGAAWVRALYVEPEMRRVGVGEAVLDEVIRIAEAHRASALEVPALPGDSATKSFLETMGMRARLLVMHRTLPR